MKSTDLRQKSKKVIQISHLLATAFASFSRRFQSGLCWEIRPILLFRPTKLASTEGGDDGKNTMSLMQRSSYEPLDLFLSLFWFELGRRICNIQCYFFRFWASNSDLLSGLCKAYFEANSGDFPHVTQNFGNFKQNYRKSSKMWAKSGPNSANFCSNSANFCSNSAKFWLNSAKISP